MTSAPAERWHVLSGDGDEGSRLKQVAVKRARQIAADPDRARPSVYHWQNGRWHLYEGWR